MNLSIIVGLLQNTAILLAFSLLYDYSWIKNEESRNTFKKVLTGLIIGGIGIVLMFTPWTFVPGIVFDTRSILLSVSGLFFGAVPTITAMAVTGIFRVYSGGDGMWMGLSVILTAGATGILWKKFRPSWKQNYQREILRMGLTVHLIMLACTLFLPHDKIIPTFRAIALSVIIIYPLGTMLLGMLMVKQFDIWQNRKVKDSLIESERRFKEVLKSVNLFSVILDTEGNIMFCNQYFLDNTGFKKDELLGKNWFEIFIPAEKNDEIRGTFKALITGKEGAANIENEILAKNGEKLVVAWSNTLLRSTEKEIIGTASIGKNVTEQRKAEEQKLRFANILEASLNEIYVFDAKTLQFRYVNFGALNNLGYSSRHILSMTPLDIKPEYTFESFHTLLNPLRNHEKKEIIVETLHRRANGSTYPVEAHIQYFDYENEKVFLDVIQDITLRKQTENQLIEAKEKAEESDRLKTTFLANMSHEIRTPMNSIMGFSGLLGDRDLNDEKKNLFIKIINNSSQRLLQLINDILDISKLESKQLTVKTTRFKLYELFNNSMLVFEKSDLLLRKPKIKLKLTVPEEYKELMISADEVRFQQVLDNLLSNALKYSEKGIVETGYLVKKGGQTEHLYVFVKDSGIGIPPEKKHLIFKRFRQVEENGYHEGAGLGLSISKGIVELMGGKIGFESEANRGSLFYFTIPHSSGSEAGDEVKKTVESELNLRGKTIIIAEDDFNSYWYLREILFNDGVNILHAENGQALMNMLADIQPELILLDISMSVKNGFECLREMKEKNIKSRIIAQTAYAMSEERTRCLNEGCHGYIAKPIRKSELIKVMKKVML